MRQVSEVKDQQILELLNKLNKQTQANQELQSLLNSIDSELLGQKHRLSVVSDKWFSKEEIKIIWFTFINSIE